MFPGGSADHEARSAPPEPVATLQPPPLGPRAAVCLPGDNPEPTDPGYLPEPTDPGYLPEPTDPGYLPEPTDPG